MSMNATTNTAEIPSSACIARNMKWERLKPRTVPIATGPRHIKKFVIHAMPDIVAAASSVNVATVLDGRISAAPRQRGCQKKDFTFDR